MIPYGRQNISKNDIEAVTRVMRSDFLTQGPMVMEFEHSIVKKVDAKYAIAVNSATSALHLSCIALDLRPADFLWTSPITFVASANCGVYCGAQIDFVDIDPNTYNICTQKLEEKLIRAEKKDLIPKILVVVHFSGQSCDMKKIHALSKKFGFKVIEDASHAIGAKYRGDYVGGCKYSDITVFSFHPVKIITSAEGGVLTTNDEEIALKANCLRSHGVTKDKKTEGDWYYEQTELGFNYRMSDIHAALGRSQLTRLDSFVEERSGLASSYDSMLKELPVNLPFVHEESYSSWHLYVIQLKMNKIKKTRKQIFDSMRAKGVGVHVHYIPVHTQPYYRNMGFSIGDFPIAEQFYQQALTIPMYPGLSDNDQRYVVKSLIESIG
jgi:UDP-4-amino-4,6-dideoxy-N-acetyl-beta-L-altrosamine transaminase